MSVNSSDYNFFLENNNIEKKYSNYTLFLDEYVPFHSDSELTKQSPPVCDNIYYNRLNTFFDYIEKNTNTEVIIAAHPSAKYSKDWNPFNKRKIIFNQTMNLIQYSDLVIGHSSTAFTYAILFKKKCIHVLDTSAYTKQFINGIFNFANFTGSFIVDLSKSFNINFNNFKIEYNKYEKFVKQFIREDDVPQKNSFMILLDYLNELEHD